MTRIRTDVNFSRCPECQRSFGVQGMARHRKARHGVQSEPAPRTRRSGRDTRTLAERLAAIDALNAAQAAEWAESDTQE